MAPFFVQIALALLINGEKSAYGRSNGKPCLFSCAIRRHCVCRRRLLAVSSHSQQARCFYGMAERKMVRPVDALDRKPGTLQSFLLLARHVIGHIAVAPNDLHGKADSSLPLHPAKIVHEIPKQLCMRPADARRLQEACRLFQIAGGGISAAERNAPCSSIALSSRFCVSCFCKKR